MILSIISIDLPITDPVLKFLIILVIILVIPILSDRLRIPHLLGMILAGVIIGPYGFNLVARDSSIILSGTAGMLYIMFLAGLEIDMDDFKNNSFKSLFLGLLGFTIPMILGTLTGIYLFKFSTISSILLASMFASHTLITYPIVSKMGVTKNVAVNISVSSTLITNTLALMVLAIIVNYTTGSITEYFWIKFFLAFIAFSSVIIFIFPIIARWFFKTFSDNVSQYIFVLVMVFSGAVLSSLAGIEAIIGAFMAGLALNRLIPATSPLMNRINFVGNAIFIPFFLIGVGMLIDYRAFGNITTIKVATVMSIIATLGKYVAARLTQSSFKLNKNEGRLIFGLTNSQAAATLAAVLVGYNIILGQDANGDPIRLLNDSVLNGTIIMILVTCTIASFATQRSARNIVITEFSDDEPGENKERILIPLSNPSNIDELINLSCIIKSPKNKRGIYALNVINSENPPPNAEDVAHKLLKKAKMAASSTDTVTHSLLRYDLNSINGVTNVIKENQITDLILGLHSKTHSSDSFLGSFTEGILSKSNVSTYIYYPLQPIATIKRHLIFVPENAEREIGFSFWLAKIWNIARNTGAKIVFHSPPNIAEILQEINAKHPINTEFRKLSNMEDMLFSSNKIKKDDNIIIVSSRKNYVSYQPSFAKLPMLIDQHFMQTNFLIIYPIQSMAMKEEKVDLTNSSLFETIEKVDVIGKTIAGIFRREK